MWNCQSLVKNCLALSKVRRTSMDPRLCLTELYTLCTFITKEHESCSQTVQSLLSAHDAEKFALLNTTWKGHKYSRGVLGFDVRPGSYWKHMLCLLHVSKALGMQEGLLLGIHSKCIPGLCSEISVTRLLAVLQWEVGCVPFTCTVALQWFLDSLWIHIPCCVVPSITLFCRELMLIFKSNI